MNKADYETIVPAQQGLRGRLLRQSPLGEPILRRRKGNMRGRGPLLQSRTFSCTVEPKSTAQGTRG